MSTAYGGSATAERPRIRVDDDGETRSLVVDETFASFYRPGEVATHCVWDAIAAPIAWLPPTRRRRILVLGLGGGSVARIARALAPDAAIEGVELDGEVVRMARDHFDLDALGVDVHVADARAWVADAQASKPGRYDAILEDVFIGAGDGVHKPDWIPAPVHDQAFRLLARGGLFVSNTLDEHAVDRPGAPRPLPRRSSRSPSRTTTTGCWSAGDAGLSGAALRRAVADTHGPGRQPADPPLPHALRSDPGASVGAGPGRPSDVAADRADWADQDAAQDRRAARPRVRGWEPRRPS